jgi:hypothetical protein
VAGSAPDFGTEDREGGRAHRESAGGTPRWVKVFGLVAAVVVLILIVLLLVGRGHGPGRHTGAGASNAAAQAAWVLQNPAVPGAQPSPAAPGDGVPG